MPPVGAGSGGLTGCCRLAAPACRWSEGDLVDARTHLERALAITESRLGGDHPETAAALSNLADVLSAQGDQDGARALHQRALAISESRLGADHPN